MYRNKTVRCTKLELDSSFGETVLRMKLHNLGMRHIPSTSVLNFLSSCSHQVLNSELASFVDSKRRMLSCGEQEYTTPEVSIHT